MPQGWLCNDIVSVYFADTKEIEARKIRPAPEEWISGFLVAGDGIEPSTYGL